jgi:membrane-bound metal-dependent hydrolase YbcI (DUF457 family)
MRPLTSAPAVARTRKDLVLYLAPVALVAAAGAAWIVSHPASARGQTHTLFQVLALAESVVALLLRRRKPAAALASILAVYLLVDLEQVTGLAVLLALLTLAMAGRPRAVALGTAATAVIVVAMPYLHGDHVTAAASLGRALAVGSAVAAGSYLRARRERRQRPGDATSGASRTAEVAGRPRPAER